MKVINLGTSKPQYEAAYIEQGDYWVVTMDSTTVSRFFGHDAERGARADCDRRRAEAGQSDLKAGDVLIGHDTGRYYLWHERWKAIRLDGHTGDEDLMFRQNLGPICAIICGDGKPEGRWTVQTGTICKDGKRFMSGYTDDCVLIADALNLWDQFKGGQP